MNLEYFKAQVNQTLSSPEGRRRYAQRKIDVETTFGNLKANLEFSRMAVQGNHPVRKELGIALMAVNLRKIVRQSVFSILNTTRNGHLNYNIKLTQLLLFFKRAGSLHLNPSCISW